MHRGRFISFEGGEGSGKSTQIMRLADKIRAQGHEVVTTREPGGTPSGEMVRELIVSGEQDRWDPTSEMLLNYAAREEHLVRIIRPALRAGKWVLCDRFADSTRAYQGKAGGVDPALLEQLEASVIGEDWPDLTFIMDIEPDEGLKRAHQRSDDASRKETRFENKERAFHQTLRQAFLEIAEREPGRCAIIDAAMPVDAIETAIWNEVVSRLEP